MEGSRKSERGCTKTGKTQIINDFHRTEAAEERYDKIVKFIEKKIILPPQVQTGLPWNLLFKAGVRHDKPNKYHNVFQEHKGHHFFDLDQCSESEILFPKFI